MTYCSSNSYSAPQPHTSQPGIYECEVTLKFRLLDEGLANCDREQLLQILLDAFSYGSDEYLEPLQAQANIQQISELEASPDMRRQLMRLRNASSLA
jgi:hypothetical protein